MSENNTYCAVINDENDLSKITNLISSGSTMSLCVVVLCLLIIKFLMFKLKRQIAHNNDSFSV